MSKIFCLFVFVTCMLDTTSSASAQIIHEIVRSRPDSREHFNIAVWKVNSAYAYSVNVTINETVTIVKFVGGLVDEKPQILWKMKNVPSMVDSVRQLLQIARLDTMQRRYTDPKVIDGMIIIFKINFRGKETKVGLHNVWIQPLYNLAVFINAHLPEKYKLGLEVLKL